MKIIELNINELHFNEENNNKKYKGTYIFDISKPITIILGSLNEPTMNNTYVNNIYIAMQQILLMQNITDFYNVNIKFSFSNNEAKKIFELYCESFGFKLEENCYITDCTLNIVYNSTCDCRYMYHIIFAYVYKKIHSNISFDIEYDSNNFIKKKFLCALHDIICNNFLWIELTPSNYTNTILFFDKQYLINNFLKIKLISKKQYDYFKINNNNLLIKYVNKLNYNLEIIEGDVKKCIDDNKLLCRCKFLYGNIQKNNKDHICINSRIIFDENVTTNEHIFEKIHEIINRIYRLKLYMTFWNYHKLDKTSEFFNKMIESLDLNNDFTYYDIQNIDSDIICTIDCTKKGFNISDFNENFDNNGSKQHQLIYINPPQIEYHKYKNLYSKDIIYIYNDIACTHKYETYLVFANLDYNTYCELFEQIREDKSYLVCEGKSEKSYFDLYKESNVSTCLHNYEIIDIGGTSKSMNLLKAINTVYSKSMYNKNIKFLIDYDRIKTFKTFFGKNLDENINILINNKYNIYVWFKEAYNGKYILINLDEVIKILLKHIDSNFSLHYDKNMIYKSFSEKIKIKKNKYEIKKISAVDLETVFDDEYITIINDVYLNKILNISLPKMNNRNKNKIIKKIKKNYSNSEDFTKLLECILNNGDEQNLITDIKKSYSPEDIIKAYKSKLYDRMEIEDYNEYLKLYIEFNIPTNFLTLIDSIF